MGQVCVSGDGQMDLKPHTSMMLAAGAPIKYVQYRLGHKRPDVTLRVYQHMTEVVERNGQDVLSEVFRKTE